MALLLANHHMLAAHSPVDEMVAQAYLMMGNVKKANEVMQISMSICTLDFSLYDLHGDSYFDVIDDWLKEFKLGSKTIRNEETVKASMVQGIVENPAFAALAKLPRYKSNVGTLKFKLGMNENEKHL